MEDGVIWHCLSCRELPGHVRKLQTTIDELKQTTQTLVTTLKPNLDLVSELGRKTGECDQLRSALSKANEENQRLRDTISSLTQQKMIQKGSNLCPENHK